MGKHWDLPKPDQKYYTIPKIWEGKNIADYIDPEIEEKLAALLAEEEEREMSGFYDIDREVDDEDTMELRKLGQHIGRVKNIHMQKNKRERRIQQAQVNRMASSKSAGSARDLKKKMQSLGLELENWEEAEMRREEKRREEKRREEKRREEKRREKRREERRERERERERGDRGERGERGEESPC